MKQAPGGRQGWGDGATIARSPVTVAPRCIPGNFQTLEGVVPKSTRFTFVFLDGEGKTLDLFKWESWVLSCGDTEFLRVSSDRDGWRLEQLAPVISFDDVTLRFAARKAADKGLRV